MIELDVLSEHSDGSGRLLVAHDYEDMRSRAPLELRAGARAPRRRALRRHRARRRREAPRLRAARLAALRELGLVAAHARSAACSPTASTRIRAAEPGLRLGWSVPRVRRDYTTDMLTAIPALAMLTGYRATLPRRARRALREGRFDAIMAHWRVVTPRARARGARGRRRALRVDGRRRAQIAKLTAWASTASSPTTRAVRARSLATERSVARRSADHAGGGAEAGRVGAGEALAARPSSAREVRASTVLPVTPLEVDDAAQRERRLAGDGHRAGSCARPVARTAPVPTAT